jgi:predicted PurR-regulated permease PerM/methanogenic corrinoid protein MtbC1
LTTHAEPGPEHRSSAAAIDRRGGDRRATTVRIFSGSVLVVAVLYLAKQVLIPIALALLFAFLLRPVVGFLERIFRRRTPAVIIALALAVSLLTLGAWSLSLQVNALAHEVAAYSGNLEQKLRDVQLRRGRSLAIVERTLERLAETGAPEEKPHFNVRVVPERKSLADRYADFAPPFEFLAASFIVVVLVFFLLSEREKLRDRLLRLAGRANLTVTTQAIGEASHRISRYIFTFAALNVAFGVVIGSGLFLLGMPHATLWGLLATLLRFIPYIGATLSAALPTILALAVFPDWYVPLAVLALFVLADQLLAGFIEPLVIGQRVGVSPTALLISTIFWAWLWGPVGFLLAIPITVGLTVLGEFIPALSVFSTLFATEPPLEDYLSFYNRLLSRDRAGAIAFADRHAEAHSMQVTFTDLFLPTLVFAQEERRIGRIAPASDHFIKDVTRELIVRLGDRNSHAPHDAPRMLASSASGERISLGTMMLAQLLRAEGYHFDYFTDLPEDDLVGFIRETSPAAVFISCSTSGNARRGIELLERLRSEFDDALLVASGSGFGGNAEAAREAGATVVATSLPDAVETITQLVKRK